MLGLQDAIAANAGTPRAGRLFRFHRTARRLAARAEKGMAAAWVRALERAQRGISEKALRTALASRDLAAAQAAIAASGFGQMMQDLEDPIARTAGATGAASAQTMRAGGYAAQFNATHPNVILFARDRSATLVRDITETAREAVRTVIALGAQEGLTIVDQARAIREVVGLPPAWASAPLRLEQAIRRGDTAAATARRLSATDKAQIRSRVAAGTVNETFIAEVRERYTKSLINRRALNIARTETIRAVNFGQHESWAQAARGGVIPRGARRFWLATPTPTLCENCAKISGMNPKGRGLEEPFDTPFGQVMYPPGHTACRCGIGLAMPPRAQALRGPGGRGGVGRKLKTAGRGANVPMLPIDRALAKMQKQGLPIEEFLMEEVPRNVAFQETASLVSAGLDDIQRMGFRVPKGVRLFLDRPSGMARGQLGGFAYGVEAHPALIFPTRTLGAMRADLGRLVQKGWVSTQNVRGLIHHELGHALHYQALGFRAKNMTAVRDMWRMTRFGKGKAWRQFAPQDLQGFAREVSGYAATSPSEFVAEVFTGLMQGERYSSQVLQMYKHLRGPIAKRWKGMFRGISDTKLIVPKGAVEKAGARVWRLVEPGALPTEAPTARVARAITTHKPATAAKQAAGDTQQRAVARATRGKTTLDNEPMDVVLKDARGRTVGIEVKTFCDQANNKVTMHPDSLARKRTWARKNKGRTVTVVVDTRDQFGFADLYSGKRYWVKEGVGSFRLDTMEGFDTLADATTYIKTGRRVLKLKGPVAYGRPARSFEGEAARGVLERASRGVKLSAGAKDAVIEYQQGIAWTPRPQRILRGMEKGALTADERAVVKGLDVALAAVRPLTDEVVVYRGAHELPAALKKVGTVFQDKGFVSTTIHGQKAVNFSSSFSERGALIRIRVPAGTRGGWLPRLTGIDFKGEGEFLLPRGLRYHVVSAERMSWGKAAGRLGGKAPSWGGSQKTWLIDVEVVPVRPIAKRWKGMFRGISDTKLIVPKGAVEKAGARVWRLVEPGALPTEAPTVESFTKKAAERGFRTLDDVADELKALVPETDVASVEFSNEAAAGTHGFFHSGTRSVHLSRDVSQRLVNFWQGQRDVSSVDAVRTLIHEYHHSLSPMLRAQKMEGWWGFLEEGIVETRAREATLRFLGMERLPAGWSRGFGSYETEVEAVQWLQKTFGRELVDQLWTLDNAAARTKLLNTKVRGWLLRKLPKQGLTVRETHAVATNLGDDAWHILRVGDQEKLLRMRGARLREYLGENYSVEIPSPAKVVRKEKLIAYDKPLKLEPLETKAVKDYQSQGWNSIINGALRKGKTSGILRVQGGAGQYDLGKTVQAIDVVLARAPRLKKSVALWRGLNGEKGLTLRPGTVFRDKGFVSTSTEMRRAAEFMLDSRKPVMLRIAAKKGQRGIWMKDAIGRTKEAEFLLPRGSRFRVVKSQVMDHSRFNREIGRVGWFYGTGLHVTVLDVQLL